MLQKYKETLNACFEIYTHVQWKRTTYENDYIFLTT